MLWNELIVVKLVLLFRVCLELKSQLLWNEVHPVSVVSDKNDINLVFLEVK